MRLPKGALNKRVRRELVLATQRLRAASVIGEFHSSQLHLHLEVSLTVLSDHFDQATDSTVWEPVKDGSEVPVVVGCESVDDSFFESVSGVTEPLVSVVVSVTSGVGS
jgi:hypothetical protein